MVHTIIPGKASRVTYQSLVKNLRIVKRQRDNRNKELLLLSNKKAAIKQTGLARKPEGGYILIFLMIVIFIMMVGLLAAAPLLQTQLKRETEEELIFRGQQYVEAIRLYQQKKPGSFPQSLEELIKEKCLRRLYADPMSESGQWDLLLIPSAAASWPAAGQESESEKLLVVPATAIKKISHPQIVGVVSSSSEKSIRIYDGEEYYQKWLFYYGQTPGKKPKLIYQQADKQL
ncbi:MAG: hypothetical protein PHU81_04095 [Acidobacteriota bacterium]|nr:hypothetical protein [Acidobacteriota bacterium]